MEELENIKETNIDKYDGEYYRVVLLMRDDYICNKIYGSAWINDIFSVCDTTEDFNSLIANKYDGTVMWDGSICFKIYDKALIFKDFLEGLFVMSKLIK